jgi:hypothetical protein
LLPKTPKPLDSFVKLKLQIKLDIMVLRQTIWFLAGVGVASFPIHAQMHNSLKDEQADIKEEFKRQRELLFHQEMKNISGQLTSSESAS